MLIQRRTLSLVLFGLLLILLLLALAPRDMLTWNGTASVQTGLYLQTPRHKATHVTFCLRTEHKAYTFFSNYCSPADNSRPSIIKRIVDEKADGALIVQGDVDRAIDSALLGPITPDQQRGFWRLLIAM